MHFCVRVCERESVFLCACVCVRVFEYINTKWLIKGLKALKRLQCISVCVSMRMSMRVCMRACIRVCTCVCTCVCTQV